MALVGTPAALAQAMLDKEEQPVETKAQRAVPEVALDKARAAVQAIRAAKERGAAQEPVSLGLAVARAVAAKVDRELVALAGKEQSTSGPTTGASASQGTTRPR